ncbi:uncharacterized protein MELLADRAFT_95593 [Melampsora larici-populina 98AG31]|uniref:Uncharacterized protein n=1 Tax=Melampsora larici-populina (strain 98AG31 / pathotype 3-4-7) TaxID=747676 RepID=F4S9W9_MELLP|nr:uncharacterized protein MELLADRAFT_95593 [Melampsora larici-populina 98AG31]EGF98525.1 hypothetical protein MELLADRAFT_95593 [Melampsora larici-populina 98AG31]
MPNTAFISAIVPTTADARPSLPIPKFVDWHLTLADLVLQDDLGAPVNESVHVYGYTMNNHKLARGRIYHLYGPFQEPVSGQAMIRHDQTAQSEIGTHSINRQEIAGKASISSYGKVIAFEYNNVHNSNGQWNLTVIAAHELAIPVIIYWFGYYTPESAQWKYIRHDLMMSFSGRLVGKDPETGRFIVNVIDYTVHKTCAI